MSREQVNKPAGKYYSVIDGTFRIACDKDHPDAITREWKTPDGKSGEKIERIVHVLFGKIEDVYFRDGDYGKTLNIALDPDEDGETPIVSVGATSRYGESLMRVLPNVNLEEEVRLRPTAYKNKKEKDVKFVEVAQRDEDGKFTKIVKDFFYDWDKSEPLNGYPTPDEEDKQDWAFFYKKANKFLVKYTEENVIPTFSGEKSETSGYDYPEELSPESIPF